MTIPHAKLHTVRVALSWVLLLMLASMTPSSFMAHVQDDLDADSRHICPKEAMRNGTCVPNPGRPPTKTPTGTGQQNEKISASTNQRKEPRYTRVAKQASTTAKCNVRVQEAQGQKSKNNCEVRLPAVIADLPITSQKIGLTIWRLREARREYEGARILSHPSATKPKQDYQAERIGGQPLLSYGDLVRMSIESPRTGYLYVFDRELYHDGSLSEPYMIFPTKRLRGGDNEIRANRPIEIPATDDDPFYFEAKRAGLDPTKKLVGEILSIVITDKPISALADFGREVQQISDKEMMSLENAYAGRAEVFELDEGVGLPYSIAERDAAADEHSRLLTHNDPVPQTFYLVEEKRNGGLLVTVALAYGG